MMIKENVSLQNYNSFGVTATAAYFVEVKTIEELQTIYKNSYYDKLPKLILGKGCNILFCGNFPGLVIHMNNQGKKVLRENDDSLVLRVSAGEDWERLVSYTVEKSWWGLENLAGIPGSVGSAPVQNIGAYGVELKDIFVQAEVFDTQRKEIYFFSKEECCFDYRSSIFKTSEAGRFIVISVDFLLRKSAGVNLSYGHLKKCVEEKKWESPSASDMAKLIEEIRKQKLPDISKIGCAGSFFKNPTISSSQYENMQRSHPGMVSFEHINGRKISAAWLIEQCGWKGYREGDAGVYPMQALVLVNYGNAEGEEILELSERIQKSVKEKFELELEREVVLISEVDLENASKYNKVVTEMFSRLPMFQRIGASAYKADLKTTWTLMETLGHPERKFKSIHIAGTNGKGSTSHYIASVFQQAGYKTALYTSPHLKDFRERIKINGECISEEAVIEFYETNKKVLEKTKASFFETTVAMAFSYFAQERVDIAIVEVGMGGRLDSTNVINPLVSIITNIAYDHVQFLGNTLPKIAAEKAGIIKEKTAVVIGQSQSASVMNVFKQYASEKKSPLYVADEIFEMRYSPSLVEAGFCFDIFKKKMFYMDELTSQLGGRSYQCKNILTAICALDILQKDFNISEDDIKQGFSKVIDNTALKGRWQTLSKKPLVICDTAHNEDGISLLLEQVQQTPHEFLHIVWGCVDDKDIKKILSLLPKEATYYFCQADIPRAMPVSDLLAEAKLMDLSGKAYESTKEALKNAKENASQNDIVLVTGSTFVVAEIC